MSVFVHVVETNTPRESLGLNSASTAITIHKCKKKQYQSTI